MGSIVVIKSLLNCDKTKLQGVFSLLLIVCVLICKRNYAMCVFALRKLRFCGFFLIFIYFILYRQSLFLFILPECSPTLFFDCFAKSQMCWRASLCGFYLKKFLIKLKVSLCQPKIYVNFKFYNHFQYSVYVDFTFSASYIILIIWLL